MKPEDLNTGWRRIRRLKTSRIHARRLVVPIQMATVFLFAASIGRAVPVTQEDLNKVFGVDPGDKSQGNAVQKKVVPPEPMTVYDLLGVQDPVRKSPVSIITANTVQVTQFFEQQTLAVASVDEPSVANSDQSAAQVPSAGSQPEMAGNWLGCVVSRRPPPRANGVLQLLAALVTAGYCAGKGFPRNRG